MIRFMELSKLVKNKKNIFLLLFILTVTLIFSQSFAAGGITQSECDQSSECDSKRFYFCDSQTIKYAAYVCTDHKCVRSTAYDENKGTCNGYETNRCVDGQIACQILCTNGIDDDSAGGADDDDSRCQSLGYGCIDVNNDGFYGDNMNKLNCDLYEGVSQEGTKWIYRKYASGCVSKTGPDEVKCIASTTSSTHKMENKEIFDSEVNYWMIFDTTGETADQTFKAEINRIDTLTSNAKLIYAGVLDTAGTWPDSKPYYLAKINFQQLDATYNLEYNTALYSKLLIGVVSGDFKIDKAELTNTPRTSVPVLLEGQKIGEISQTCTKSNACDIFLTKEQADAILSDKTAFTISYSRTSNSVLDFMSEATIKTEQFYGDDCYLNEIEATSCPAGTSYKEGEGCVKLKAERYIADTSECIKRGTNCPAGTSRCSVVNNQCITEVLYTGGSGMAATSEWGTAPESQRCCSFCPEGQEAIRDYTFNELKTRCFSQCPTGTAEENENCYANPSSTFEISKYTNPGKPCGENIYLQSGYCAQYDYYYDLAAFITGATTLPIQINENPLSGELSYGFWPQCGDGSLETEKGESCLSCPGDIYIEADEDLSIESTDFIETLRASEQINYIDEISGNAYQLRKCIDRPISEPVCAIKPACENVEEIRLECRELEEYPYSCDLYYEGSLSKVGTSDSVNYYISLLDESIDSCCYNTCENENSEFYEKAKRTEEGDIDICVDECPKGSKANGNYCYFGFPEVNPIEYSQKYPFGLDCDASSGLWSYIKAEPVVSEYYDGRTLRCKQDSDCFIEDINWVCKDEYGNNTGEKEEDTLWLCEIDNDCATDKICLKEGGEAIGTCVKTCATNYDCDLLTGESCKSGKCVKKDTSKLANLRSKEWGYCYRINELTGIASDTPVCALSSSEGSFIFPCQTWADSACEQRFRALYVRGADVSWELGTSVCDPGCSASDETGCMILVEPNFALENNNIAVEGVISEPCACNGYQEKGDDYCCPKGYKFAGVEGTIGYCCASHLSGVLDPESRQIYCCPKGYFWDSFSQQCTPERPPVCGMTRQSLDTFSDATRTNPPNIEGAMQQIKMSAEFKDNIRTLDCALQAGAMDLSSEVSSTIYCLSKTGASGSISQFKTCLSDRGATHQVCDLLFFNCRQELYSWQEDLFTEYYLNQN